MPPSLRYLQDRWEEPPEEWDDEESPEEQEIPLDDQEESE